MIQKVIKPYLFVCLTVLEPFLVSVRDSVGMEMPFEQSNPFISAANILVEKTGYQQMNILSDDNEEVQCRVRERVTER